MTPTKETFTLFLTTWQVRMVHDFLPDIIKKIDRIILKPGSIHCPYSYKIPSDGLSRRDWIIYLTDEQMTIVKERFNLKTTIPGINITEKLLDSKSVVFM